MFYCNIVEPIRILIYFILSSNLKNEKGLQAKMKLKKLKICILFFLIILSPNYVLADDYLENENTILNLEIESSINSSNTPSINARHAVIFDRSSKSVIYGKDENGICKMASTTKILTAIIVLENCNDLNQIVTISKKAARNRWF